MVVTAGRVSDRGAIMFIALLAYLSFVRGRDVKREQSVPCVFPVSIGFVVSGCWPRGATYYNGIARCILYTFRDAEVCVVLFRCLKYKIRLSWVLGKVLIAQYVCK